MSKKLARKNDAVAAFLEAVSSVPMVLLKFKKTKFVMHDTEVALGTEYIANCAEWSRGWLKFEGDELLERRMGRVADRFRVPERDELGDMDKSLWGVDDEGLPNDPWVRQDCLPFENPETGEYLVFVTSSTGGRIAVEGLCNRFVRNLDKGLPRIKLATATFHTRKFGDVNRPDFPIVGWNAGGGGLVDITPHQPNREPQIEEGPPENDPDDPGYELSTFSRDDDDYR